MRKVSRRSTAIAFSGLAVMGLAVFLVAAATASTKHRTATIDVCVLLPDTKSSVRWVQFDAPYFKAAFAKAGVKASINNALNDPLKQKAQAQACLAAGAKVVIETSLDNGSAASIEKLFTSKGGKAIDYDRLVLGGSASVYVTFDGTAVGKAQANGVIAANDNIAGAVIADLKAKHLPPVPLSGQDATAQGVQYILAGWQSGTTFKYNPDEVNGAAAAAIALLKGQKPKTTTTRKNGSRNEPTVALPITWITKANYKILFTKKFLKKSDVCIGAYAKYCK